MGQQMRIKKSSNHVIALLMICAVVTSFAVGCSKKFDASGYARGVLDVVFQDETAQALETMEGATEKKLHEMHEESILTFAEQNITNEIEMNETQKARFLALCEKIFEVMKYNVLEAKETGDRCYEVPVEINPSDIFVRFQEALYKDSEKIAEKINAGGYQGTNEEISRQVLNDIVNHSYELLDVSYTEMEYGEAETVILEVEAGEEKEYSINEEDMQNLMLKILRLDEIQG